MPLSRLRLRLGLGFALAFAVGLAVLVAVSLGYLWRESHRRLDNRLDAMVNDISINLKFELGELPRRTSIEVASEVVAEWPRNGGSFVICDSQLQMLAYNDSGPRAQEILGKLEPGNRARSDVVLSNGEKFRVSSMRYQPVLSGLPAQMRSTPFQIVAYSSLSGISEDTELLVAAVGIAAPIIILLSLTGGYLLAARALRPVTDLTEAVSNIAPDDLSRRLAVAEPKDELGQLASEFNAMLARLSTAQMQNRKFVREAAHQIRTPLTLVLGEAALVLATPDSPPDQMRGSLKRIGLAAERMRRRVDELFLLAEAQTGEPVLLTEVVELEHVVFRAVELMRPRAVAMGRALVVGSAETISIHGNSELLNEALLEMLENALRHGDASRSVTVSVAAREGRAAFEVVSGGRPFTLPERTEKEGPDGLGLPIVRWVAEKHGGELLVTNHSGWNSLVMMLPRDA
ncbi:MAG: HAMP domain-containing protein [Gemmatimonas sp.]